MEPRKLENLSFEEAVLEKSRYPSDVMKIKGYEKFVMIAPNKQDECREFLEFATKNFSKYTDELCKTYCSDSKYQIRLHVVTDLHN